MGYFGKGGSRNGEVMCRPVLAYMVIDSKNELTTITGVLLRKNRVENTGVPLARNLKGNEIKIESKIEEEIFIFRFKNQIKPD